MKVFSIFLITVSLLLSCHQPKQPETDQFEASGNKLAEADLPQTAESAGQRVISLQLADYLTKPVTDTSLVKAVDQPVALFVYPTEAEIKKMELELGEDLTTVADDNAFYFSQASDWLDSLQMKRVVLDKRYIRFNQSTGEPMYFDTRCSKAPY